MEAIIKKHENCYYEKMEFAQKIANHIFALGNEPNSPTQRIQFMGGNDPDNEKEQGGLCLSALTNRIMEIFNS